MCQAFQLIHQIVKWFVFSLIVHAQGFLYFSVRACTLNAPEQEVQLQQYLK